MERREVADGGVVEAGEGRAGPLVELRLAGGAEVRVRGQYAARR